MVQGRDTLEAYASTLWQYPTEPKFYSQPSSSRHLRRMHQLASTTWPAPPLRQTFSVVDPELWALVNPRLVLMNREDLYLIVVSQVVSSTGRACILTCCYTSDSMRKWNGEETCLQNAASHGKAKAAVDLRAMDQPAAGGGITKGDAQHTKLSQHLPGPHRCVRGVNQAVLLMNREDLYGIAVVQVVPYTRCTTAQAYHFVDDSMLKRNPEETCHYTAVSSGVTQGVSVPERDGFSENSLVTNGCRICVRLSLAVSIEYPLAARSKIRLDLGTQRAAYRNYSDITSVGTNDAFKAVTRMEASDAATDVPLDYHVSNTAPPPMHSASAGGSQNLQNAWGSSIVTVMLVTVYQPSYRVREDTVQFQTASVNSHAQNQSG